MQGNYREPMISEIDIAPVASARAIDEKPTLDVRRWLAITCAAIFGAAAGLAVFFG